jgi:hypothetical protein
MIIGSAGPRRLMLMGLIIGIVHAVPLVLGARIYI